MIIVNQKVLIKINAWLYACQYVLPEVIVTSFIWIRNRRRNTIDVSNMIVLVVTLFDLVYKLAACHISSREVIMKTFISSGTGFAGYGNAFSHISIFLSIRHAIQPCN